MTAHRHLKERIRARMARTGESYTTARRHVLNALPPAEYQLGGGVHPDTHAIAGVLANRGLLAPHTGQPLTEAMVLGVGGGLGAGYILWEFKANDHRGLVFGFRNNWQYPDRWALKTCARLGVPADMHETGSTRRAAEELAAAVGRGVPAIVWADQQLLGYRYLPAWLEGSGGPPVTVYGLDEPAGEALVDDRNRAPLTVPLDARAAARARVVSYRQRQVVLDAPGAELDLDGLRGGRSRRLGRAGRAPLQEVRLVLPARLPQVGAAAHRHRERQGLAQGVRRPGQPVRRLPVGLREPGAVRVGRREPARALRRVPGRGGRAARHPTLGEAAAAYREAAARWHEVAGVAMPAGAEPFAEARRLTDQLQAQVERGDAGRGQAAATAGRLWALRDRWRPQFPGDDDQVDALLAGLAAAVGAACDAEEAALADLAGALAS
jgi:hypothetical protein